MCGIIGYVGNDNAVSVLLESLKLLEYRGYDSAGVVFNRGNESTIIKCAGMVSDLVDLVGEDNYGAKIGLGHTRWATHGEVNYTNAHPHNFGNVTIVHNGIIENYKELINTYGLADKLQSQTDTEVIAAVLDHYYENDPFEAIKKTVSELKGTFALGIMFKDRPEELYCIRKVSPIVGTYSNGQAAFASDLVPLSKFSDKFFVLPEMVVMKADKDGLYLTDLEGNAVKPEYYEFDWEIENASKGGYPFYMEKEIHEEPKAIRATLEDRIVNGLPDFAKDEIPDEFFEDLNQAVIIACGTSYHAGLVAKHHFEKYAKLHTDVVLASEYANAAHLIDGKTLVMAISQSGETIDTLRAFDECKKYGVKTLAILNVKNSSISRSADHSLYTYSGPEIAVASTKAYTSQLAAISLLTAKMAMVRKTCSEEEVKKFIADLVKVPEGIEKVLAVRNDYHLLSRELVSTHDLFMIGRGLDYLALMEGALKIKEISYIHAEAFASGELKHGTIALIEKDLPVLAGITQEELLLKQLSNIKEVKSRGGKIYAFVKESLVDKLEDNELTVYPLPDLNDDFMVFEEVVLLQLLAYYLTIDKGYDVDKPRNLAKVVTVE